MTKRFTAAQRKAFKPGDDVAFNLCDDAAWFRIISREGDFILELKAIRADGTTHNMASQFQDVDHVKQHRTNNIPGSLAKAIMQEATRDTIFDSYQCLGWAVSGYHVERKHGAPNVWIVPGTYQDDPSRRVIENSF